MQEPQYCYIQPKSGEWLECAARWCRYEWQHKPWLLFAFAILHFPPVCRPSLISPYSCHTGTPRTFSKRNKIGKEHCSDLALDTMAAAFSSVKNKLMGHTIVCTTPAVLWMHSKGNNELFIYHTVRVISCHIIYLAFIDQPLGHFHNITILLHVCRSSVQLSYVLCYESLSTLQYRWARFFLSFPALFRHIVHHVMCYYLLKKSTHN